MLNHRNDSASFFAARELLIRLDVTATFLTPFPSLPPPLLGNFSDDFFSMLSWGGVEERGGSTDRGGGVRVVQGDTLLFNK